jgi:hypothetical protein
MVNIYEHNATLNINIVIKCKNCVNQALYNFIIDKNTLPLYCKDHIFEETMIDVVSNQCNHMNDNNIKCTNRAKYNFIANMSSEYLKKKYIDFNEETHKGYMIIPISCLEHKQWGMVDVDAKRCKIKGCNTVNVEQINDGVCEKCYCNSVGEVYNKSFKDDTIFELIKRDFPNLVWYRNTKFGKSAYKPDFITKIDGSNNIIVIEIDDYQHKNYKNETDRMDILSNEIKNMGKLSNEDGYNTVFIRYNPDTYKIGDININTYWDVDTNNKMQITNQLILDQRYDLLKYILKKYINTPLTKKLTVEYLFYDC